MAVSEDDVRSIFVNPQAWADAAETDRHDYEAAASAHNVSVEMGGGASRDAVILLHSVDGVAQMTFEDRSYGGAIACSRAPWEHALRLVLGLDDPCFAAP